MKLILRSDIEKLGRMGEVVQVSDGYARNFLIPRRLAVAATPDNERRIEAERQRRTAHQAAQVKQVEDLARKLEGKSVTLPVRATDDDQLYGSVTAEQIADALRQEEDLPVEPDWVRLAEPIRRLGVYDVSIVLSEEARAAVKVWVISEDQDSEGSSDQLPVTSDQ